MWKPLSIVSGLLLLAAAGIMYTQIREPLSSERKQLAAAEANKTSALANQGESKKARAQSDLDLDESKTLLATNTRKKNEAQATKDAKVAEVTTATTEKDAAATALAEIEEKLKGLGGLERLVSDLKVLEAKKELLSSSITNTQGAIESTISHKASTDKVVAALRQRDQYQKTGTMVPNFRSRVSAVNPELGFVVLAHGNSSNVTKGAKFDATRSGAKLVVTHLEQNRSIAEVIPGTLTRGENILPGDVVVVSPSSAPRAASTAPATGGTTKPAPKPEGTAPAPAPADPFAPPTTPGGTPPVTEPEKPETPSPDVPPASGAPTTPEPEAPAPAPAPAPTTPPKEEMKPKAN